MKNQITNDDLFDQLAEQSPIHEDINGFRGDGDKSLDQYENENTHLSDFQTLIKTLSPDFKNDVFNAIMVCRLTPNNFRPMLKILTNAEIKRQPTNKPINVAEVSMKIYTILSIALDGKHILDILEAFGSSKSTAEMEQLAQNLGIKG